MNIDEEMRNILQETWPDWKVVKELGRGSYGIVYQITHKGNIGTDAAAKVIPIPQDVSEVKELQSEGQTMDEVRTYFKEVTDGCVRELTLMYSLKDQPNIVQIEDHKVVRKKDGVGWYILIREELLTSLKDYMTLHPMSEGDVIKLGMNICSALEACSKQYIIHRDIKPENLFISHSGVYKLGDFGIARKLENMTVSMSVKGTSNYMAPEIIRDPNYDSTVDIYSLGLVMYRLMNKNKMPFIDIDKRVVSVKEREEATRRRIDGESFPPPCGASKGLSAIILKACAFDPAQRFQTSTETKKALAKQEKLWASTAAAPSNQSLATNAEPAGKTEYDERPDKQAENSAGSQQSESVKKTQGNKTASPAETDQKSTPKIFQSDNSGNLHGSAGGNNKKRLSNRRIYIIIAAAVAVVIVTIIVILFITLSRENTIDLNKYVSVSFTGSNGSGEASVEIDKTRLIQEYNGKLQYKIADNEEMKSLESLYSPYYADPVYTLVENLTGSLDRTSGLSNGDTIQFTWTINKNNIESLINVKLNYSNFEYTVSGLQPSATYDAFMGVSVEFTGISPEASASLKSSFLPESAYELDKSEGLAIGDTVTVTISEDAAENLAEDEGEYPAEMSCEYTVENIPYYANSVDELPDDAMEEMKFEAENLFRSYVAENWEPGVIKFKSMNFLGTYFLYRKDVIEEDNVNKIYLIYKVQSTFYDENKAGALTAHDLEYYIYIGFFDGVISPSEIFSIDYTEYDCPWDRPDSVSFNVTYYNEYSSENDRDSEMNLNIAGTQDLDRMFTYLVTSQAAYTYEDTVTDS